MKSRLFKPLLAIACLLGSINASAYDFEVDGIYYDVVSLTEFTCKVAQTPSNGERYAGDIVIPTQVKYADKTLTVTSIGNYAFYCCSNLTSLIIPNSVTSIGGYAFHSCSGLTSIIIPNSVTSIGGYAFWGCGCLTSIKLPDFVTSIGSYAFSYCSGLTSIIIPNSVTSIGEYAFYKCSNLTSIAIPNSVTSIGRCAFYGCCGLTNIVIPESVTSTGGYMVYDCTALTALYFLCTTPPDIDEDYFTTNQYMTLNVFVPEEALPVYQSADGWKNFWNLQGFDPTGIDNVKNDIVNCNAKCHDIRGNRLCAPKRGLNIINGKKVIVK